MTFLGEVVTCAPMGETTNPGVAADKTIRTGIMTIRTNSVMNGLLDVALSSSRLLGCRPRMSDPTAQSDSTFVPVGRDESTVTSECEFGLQLRSVHDYGIIGFLSRHCKSSLGKRDTCPA